MAAPVAVALPHAAGGALRWLCWLNGNTTAGREPQSGTTAAPAARSSPSCFVVKPRGGGFGCRFGLPSIFPRRTILHLTLGNSEMEVENQRPLGGLAQTVQARTPRATRRAAPAHTHFRPPTAHQHAARPAPLPSPSV